jgi:Ca2+-binding EF-hand superfamily protein
MEEREDELRMLFQGCDSNGNGSLQFSEFVTLLENLGAGMGAEECTIGFTEIDTDRDGRINFAEFLRWWEEH